MKSTGRNLEESGREGKVLDALSQCIDAHPEVLRPVDAGLGACH